MSKYTKEIDAIRAKIAGMISNSETHFVNLDCDGIMRLCYALWALECAENPNGKQPNDIESL